MTSARITYDDVLKARAALRPYLDTTPVRSYPLLDADIGHGIRLLVKHENHLPMNTFKTRNATAALLRLGARADRGVIAASTGNHGQGLAWAGARLGVPVTVCVPKGNNPDKGAAIRSYGARLIETGATYDDSATDCERIAEREGLEIIHSTNNDGVLAGAATMTAELLEQAPHIDTLVIALGGGSQAVGAIVTRDVVKPSLDVIAVQSEGARAQRDAWHDGQTRRGEPVHTFAEGIATGSTYEHTFATLRDGLTDFALVSEAEIAQGVRDMLRITHNVAEGAGATGLAGVRRLAPKLAGRTVGIILCGGNISVERLRAILVET